MYVHYWGNLKNLDEDKIEVTVRSIQWRGIWNSPSDCVWMIPGTVSIDTPDEPQPSIG